MAGFLIDDWPNCSVPDCENKVCLRLGTGKCWPHTMGLPLGWSHGIPQEERERISKEIEQAWQERQQQGD